VLVQSLLQWTSNKYYTTWVCVFAALGIQHAMRMRHIVICGLSRSTIFFHIISQTARISKRNATEHKMCFFSTTLLETFLILRRNARDMIKMYMGLHVKRLLFLSEFNETWIFSTHFRRIFKYQISWKSVQWEPSCSMRRNGQRETWRSFSLFCKRALKNRHLRLPVFSKFLLC
jgi:hypothetical protein